ncbi:MAG: hypothetical protein A3H27_07245 [Acidobacteria bacterium RIFCSPLOWO2_02_FULL_59_13]|nr:MAG: hypothetical protein A3H27_07245 [Acidobacteria bacterium RIFCSPLOWO2_02_FULL_59_13]
MCRGLFAATNEERAHGIKNMPWLHADENPPMVRKASNTRAIVDDLPFLQELVGIGEDIVTTLRNRPKPQVPDRLITVFAAKAAQTARAIVVLYQHGLALEAQSLVRILFEVSVSFDAFLHLLRKDPKSACHRLLDAMALEKSKQQRASNYAGHELVEGAPGPDEFAQKEKEIALRYSTSELKSMRKYGFSGLSVEDRARQAGCKDYYDIIYRNFSRNVHGSDFSELMLANDPSMLEDRRGDFFESRDSIALDVAYMALWSVTDRVNGGFGLCQDARLGRVDAKRRAARNNSCLPKSS